MSAMIIYAATLCCILSDDKMLQPWQSPSADLRGLVDVQGQNRWGMADTDLRATLEAELLRILEGPVETTRGGALSARDRLAIETDPELQEAFRSAPAATLSLIQRIRDAGGLKQ